MSKADDYFEEGSGNVFLDLELPHSDELLQAADLARSAENPDLDFKRRAKVIRERCWTCRHER